MMRLSSLIAAAKSYGSSSEPLFLPGIYPPEQWIWETLQNRSTVYAKEYGIVNDRFIEIMADIDRAYSSASDKPANIIKNKLQTLSEQIATTIDIAQKVGCIEAQENKGDIAIFLQELEAEILKWRSRK